MKSKKRSAAKTRSGDEPPEPTFFLDRCLGRYELPAKLREAKISVEVHADHFPEEQLVKDEEWISFAAKKGWYGLTKDKRMHRHHQVREVVHRYKAVIFAYGRQGLSAEEMAKLFISRYVSIKKFIKKTDAPFIASIARAGTIRKIYP